MTEITYKRSKLEQPRKAKVDFKFDVPQPTEFQIQKAIKDWCDLKQVIIVHIPHEGKRSKYLGGKLKEVAMAAGFPDLFFPGINSKYRGLFIELKRDKKSFKSFLQKWWIDKLNELGYSANFAHGFDEAIKIIEDYIHAR